jgi:flavorubredoxin
MKKFLISFILFFFISQFCAAYTGDSALTQCIKDAGVSYSYRYDCYCARQEYYKTQNEKLLKELKLKLSKPLYGKVTGNQIILSKYIQLLNNGEIKILNDTNGLMYQTFAQEIILMLSETNFQILSLINNNTINRDKLSQNPKEPDINEYISKLKNNLTPTQYGNVMRTQSGWEKYKKDVEINILPLVQEPESKKYIQQIIVEDRINSLINVKFLFN